MIYNTNLKVKEENFEEFAKLVKNQIIHGGEKYKGNNDEEFTDLICRSFPGESGVDWIMGTIMKYLGRYKNFKREKDLLKISAYCYIMWLKGGFFLEDNHDQDIENHG